MSARRCSGAAARFAGFACAAALFVATAGHQAFAQPGQGARHAATHAAPDMPHRRDETVANDASRQRMPDARAVAQPSDAASATTRLPRTPIPPLTDADRAAARAPAGAHVAHAMHDDDLRHYLVFDRLEAWRTDPGSAVEWEAKAWIGTDLDRLWLRSEGEATRGRLESADLEALYGRAIGPWWDAVVGLRHDFKPGAAQDFAAVGVMGQAPYKFEVAATAYVGGSGQTAGRVEVEYETLLTNRLILQPLLEINLYGRDDARRAIGAGLSTVEAGLRLRYEIDRRFAPYVGIVRERAYGRTAEFRRGEGERADDTRFVIGARIWF